MRPFKFTTVLLILTTSLFSCGMAFINNEAVTGYDLSKPDKSVVLPDILYEVSGLTHIDATTFACIQDEKGILFFYDTEKNAIKRQCTFYTDGDYEDIARVGDTMFVLQSDGTLFEIKPFTSDNFRLNTYNTGIPANDNEGLCYDRDNNRLLIACKGKIGKGSEYHDKRAIYGFDLQTKQLTDEPVFDFDLEKIKAFAIKKHLNLPTKTRKNKGKPITEPLIKFRTSAIGIHPLTKQLFILSATDHLLFITDRNGNMEHIEQLNPAIFNKAEGITFYENGDMLISNEGQNKKPTVLRFNYKKQ